MFIDVKRSIAAPVCVATALFAATLSAATASGPITIAAILTTSGPAAPLGESEQNALTMLEHDVNAHGGIGGQPIHFTFQDDENKPDIAAQLATAAVAGGAVAIVCGTRTATAIAVARATAASSTPIVYMTPTAAVWQTRNGVAANVFQANPRDELEASKIVTAARTMLHAHSIGVLHDENEYGTNGARILADEAKRQGVQIVDDESYAGDATDFTPQVEHLKAAKPDVIVIWGATQTPALATRAVRQLGLTVPLIGSSGILSEGYLRVAGSSADGVYSVTSLAFTNPDPAQKRFLKSYRDTFHTRPNAFAAFGWDAGNLIVAGLRASKSPGGLAAAMQAMAPVGGVDGTYHFSATDHNGLTAGTLHVAYARNGVWFTQ